MVDQCTTETSLTDAFIKNSAIFHKTCVTAYNRDKLKKASHANEDTPLPAKYACCTCCNIDVSNFASLCFFCDQTGELHETISIDKHAQYMAEELNDTKLIARLVAGGMCAMNQNTIKL